MTLKKDVESQIVDESRNDSNANKADVVGNSAKVQQTLCSYIMQALLPPDCGIALEPDDDLLSIEFLDSMQFMRLVQYVEETYKVKIPPEDLLIENFQTVERLTEYLSERL